MSQKVTGVVPALVTPFYEDLSLNTSVIPRLVGPLLDAGCAGLFVCGASGEPTTMTLHERQEMAEATIKEVAHAVPVIVHVGATDTESAITLARHAMKSGATAVGSLPPLKRGSLHEDLDYYKRVASSTNLPFYIYWRADTTIGPEQFFEQIATLPNLYGVKFTDPDFSLLQKLSKLTDGNLNLLTGLDEMFVRGLVMGSHGAIGTTYNFMLRHYVSMYDDFLHGRIQAAQLKQSQANELISLLGQYGIISGTKAMLNALGIPVGPARPANTLTQFTRIQPRQLKQMLEILEKYKLA